MKSRSLLRGCSQGHYFWALSHLPSNGLDSYILLISLSETAGNHQVSIRDLEAISELFHYLQVYGNLTPRYGVVQSDFCYILQSFCRFLLSTHYVPGIRNIVDKGNCPLCACSPAKGRKTIIKSLSADIIGS